MPSLSVRKVHPTTVPGTRIDNTPIRLKRHIKPTTSCATSPRVRRNMGLIKRRLHAFAACKNKRPGSTRPFSFAVHITAAQLAPAAHQPARGSRVVVSAWVVMVFMFSAPGGW